MWEFKNSRAEKFKCFTRFVSVERFSFAVEHNKRRQNSRLHRSHFVTVYLFSCISIRFYHFNALNLHLFSFKKILQKLLKEGEKRTKRSTNRDISGTRHCPVSATERCYRWNARAQ